MRAFDDDSDGRIVFGVGAEDRTAAVLEELGAARVLLVALPHHRAGAERVAKALGPRCVGIFDDLAQHVPVAKAEAARARAREAGADWVVSHGGGTATGFAKAVALTEPVKVGAVVTTYAGSERTSIWGLTGPDGKQTGRDPRVRPSLVVYDPALTVALSRERSLMSLLNALAQCVAVLTAPAEEAHAEAARVAAARVIGALGPLAEAPDDLEARTDALYGAYLASVCIERATLGVHHQLAHALGGTFGVEHSAAHTAVLPYSLAFNAVAVPDLVSSLQPVLGDDPSAALYDLARGWELPHSLKGLDLTVADLPRLVDAALARPYANPREVDRPALERLVSDAYHARRPSRHSRSRRLGGEGPHAGLLATERGAPLRRCRAVLIALHGRGAAADRITRDLEAPLPPREGLCVLAPQAHDNRWYPKGFTAPLQDNQPDLDSALAMVDAAWNAAVSAVDASRVLVAGFSQGACLALSWAKLRGVRPGAVLAFSGAALEVEGSFDHLAGARVVMSKSEGDPWIPSERFAATADALRSVGAELTVRVVPGDGHAITDEDGADLAAAVAAALG